MLQDELDQVIEEESKNRQEVHTKLWFSLYAFCWWCFPKSYRNSSSFL